MHPCPAHGCRDIDGNPALTDKPLCGYHTQQVTRALDDFPRLYVQLSMAMSANTIGNDDLIQMSKNPPLPINVTARALCEDMLSATRRAETTYRQHRGWSAGLINRGRELPTLVSRCRFVAVHLDGILTLEVDNGLDMLRIKHDTRHALGLTKLYHRLPAPCPECDLMTLSREDGDSWVRCRSCGLTFNEDAYGVLVRVLADANPEKPPTKRNREKCGLSAPRSGLACRIETGHGCGHLAYGPNYTQWETWK